MKVQPQGSREPREDAGVTRGQFLTAAGGAAVATGLAGRASAAGARELMRAAGARRAPTPPSGPFRSRPDLRPPPLSIAAATAASAAAVGYTFLGPTNSHGSQAGPLIVDTSGQPVWFHPLPSGQLASCVRVQLYRGQPVLTWWQGKVTAGYGKGQGVILDTSYREIARVQAARGRQADLHEFLLTPQGTALITCYPDSVRADLSHFGGPKQAHVLDSIIQEIDVATGRLLLEWRGRHHVALSESHARARDGFDYLHANSIDLDADGDLLISGRHTWAVYKVSRRGGQVVWRLGGKRSDYAVDPAARFAWQHDARALSDTLISVFDDGEGEERTETQSRGLLLALDAAHRRARLIRAFRHPQPLLSPAMGNMQLLPDGHVVIGWGALPWMSEFDAEGRLVADLRLPSGCQSYRGLRFPWRGTPPDAPAVAVSTDRRTGAKTLYVSWNGATDVAAWVVRAGASVSALRPVALAARRGFETAISLRSASGYAAVTAVSAAGAALGSSRAVKI